MKLRIPGDNGGVRKLAVPFTSAAVPRIWPPSRNSTWPVGAEPETVLDKVTRAPASAEAVVTVAMASEPSQSTSPTTRFVVKQPALLPYVQMIGQALGFGRWRTKCQQIL